MSSPCLYLTPNSLSAQLGVSPDPWADQEALPEQKSYRSRGGRREKSGSQGLVGVEGTLTGTAGGTAGAAGGGQVLELGFLEPKGEGVERLIKHGFLRRPGTVPGTRGFLPGATGEGLGRERGEQFLG